MPNLTARQRTSLYALIKYYRREEKRAARAKAFLPAVIMLGCQIETALLLMVDANEEEFTAIAEQRNVPLPGKPLIQWDLGNLLPVVSRIGWLPTKWVQRKRPLKRRMFHTQYTLLTEGRGRTRWRVGDWAHFLRVLRNLVHPGRYARENPDRLI